MRLASLLLALLAFLFFAPPAMAAPPQRPPAPGKSAALPAPAPKRPAPAGHRPVSRPNAKKEEEAEEEMPDDGETDDEDPESDDCEDGETEDSDSEDDTTTEEEDPEKQKKAAKGRENYFAGLWKGVTGQRNAALEAAQKEIADLRAENAALRKENRKQAQQLAHFDANWPAIEAALTQGTPDAPALSTKIGKKVAATVMKTAAQQMKGAGHNPAKLPGPGAQQPPAPLPAAGAKAAAPAFGTPEFSAVSDAFWSARRPGSN